METTLAIFSILNELIAMACLVRATTLMISTRSADIEALTWLFAAGLAHFWIPR